MLQLKNVKKFYQAKGGNVYALNGVNLTFPEKGLIFISGKSGCGKTTLLNVIGGLDGIDEGEIFVQGKNLSKFSAQEYDNYRNTFIGFIFQEYNLIPEFTVEQNIKIAMELQGSSISDEAFKKLITDVGIANLTRRKPSELSGGQRQRVAIARALIKQPQIIMADEPTGALDSATGIQVLEILKKLSQDKLVIVVSHDREFAEKYADRMIRLVDGQILEDVTFSESEISANLNDTEETLIVKEGADLSSNEKDVLALAVKNRKKITFTEKLSYRERKETGTVTLPHRDTIAFKKSKMKLKSAALLGVKSLGVKPFRLALTILISALAFAVFGIFDTLANFSVESVLKNSIKTSPTSTLTTTFQYMSDGDEWQEIKVSQNKISQLAQSTSGVAKGIFDLDDNTAGRVYYTYPILEISSSSAVKGKHYYTDSISGFIAFNKSKEINSDGTFKDFPYRLIYGEYPTLSYADDGEVDPLSLDKVAISTYLADSILYYLQFSPLNGETIATYTDLLSKQITVRQKKYTITGIIDCGEIPSKYDSLKDELYSKYTTSALAEDYKTYIHSGAHQCFFVADGFLQALNEENPLPSVYYSGDSTWSLYTSDTTRSKSCPNYMYNASEFAENNVLFFSDAARVGMELADDEIFIDFNNIRALLGTYISNLGSNNDRSTVKALLENLAAGTFETNRQSLDEIQRILNIDLTTDEITRVTLTKTSNWTKETISKDLKIVGIYFGSKSNTSDTTFKFALSENLMREYKVYEQQGDYSKILFSKSCLTAGADEITRLITNEQGFALQWYNNPVLSVLYSNEGIIKQVANLFLYAALALVCFSVFMLYNYISTSISNKRRSVGVLRGLGASGKDVLLTFLSESLIIALINGIFANVFASIGCMLVNSYVMNTMNIFVAFALFGWRQILLITGISLCAAVVSSALPIVKISKKKPVELIRTS